MPAVAVGAAVWGGAALAGGGLTVFATIAAIGAVAAGVGVVTKSKDLMKIGAVMGLVGGVGALAQSAGVLGASSVAAKSAGAAAGAADVAAAAAPGAAAATPGAVAQEALQSVVPNAIPDVAAAGGGTAAGATAAQAGVPAAVEGMVNAPIVSKATASFLDVAKEFAQPAMKFVKDNQMFSYGLLQVGGSAIQGLFDTSKEGQEELYKSRAELDRQRATNIAAPLPGATSAPRRDVYGRTERPTYLTPAPGLLNITGRAA
ncbi:MAG: hypothetical protein Q8Q14_01475 [Gemmatimonadales bacterium]|nr:hypothetical protein [Gemmatimonadales bacterium]